MHLLGLDLQLALVRQHLPGHARMLGKRLDPLGARHEQLDGARMRVGALALDDQRAHAVTGNGARDEHHIAALAVARNPLAAVGERVDLELELLPALRPRGSRLAGGRLDVRRGARVILCGRAHRDACSTSSSSSAFWAWRRFSACSQMRWREPYRTSAVISSPGCAGRQ
jgi:hypothetical protein